MLRFVLNKSSASFTRQPIMMHMRAMSSTSDSKNIIMIGSSGAIGQRLAKQFADSGWNVIAALHRTPLPEHLANHPSITSEFNFNIRDEQSVNSLFEKFADDVYCVWNLAAPLSVETQKDPSAAEDVTVKGMERVLTAMGTHGVRKICFSDSIGSFGFSSPRDFVPARWLTENPTQDPGSEYGKQKRRCRELMQEFSKKFEDADTRWAIIPGVLHESPTWGAGTTEYALEALASASKKEEYLCPVPLDKALPMIHVEDLVNGLQALMETDRARVTQPEGGYALAGFSFDASELFHELETKQMPGFRWREEDVNPDAAFFAKAWPCSLSPTEATNDLGFTAKISFEETIGRILRAHAERS